MVRHVLQRFFGVHGRVHEFATRQHGRNHRRRRNRESGRSSHTVQQRALGERRRGRGRGRGEERKEEEEMRHAMIVEL